MLEGLRNLLRSMAEKARSVRQDLSGARVRVAEDPGVCPICSGPWLVQKTLTHQVKSLKHGQLEAAETVHVCAAGCRHPSGARVIRRAESLSRQIISGRVVSYDVIVFVGLERFLRHRQREEIREALWAEHGIPLSCGEISNLCVLFLSYLQALHEAHAEQLKAAMASDGGWPLHVDATGEDGRGTLLVVLSGWRHWVLGSWKIPTERADALLPCLLDVVARFGDPCAVMRDLGRAVTRAVEDLVAERQLAIAVLACHLHFLKDIGRDLLEPSHAELRETFRRFKVRPRLRALARELGRKLGGEVEKAREEVRSWQEDSAAGRSLPSGRAGLATVRAVAQWVLDYSADASGEDFPFDRPYLHLYNRCILALRAVEGFLSQPPEDTNVLKALKKLKGVLHPVNCEVPLRPIIERLNVRAGIFDKLRKVLRLALESRQRPADPATQAQTREQTEEVTPADLQEVRSGVESLTDALRVRRKANAVGFDERKAIDLVLRHLDKHGDYLWGHEIELPAELGGGVRLVDRTNNALEEGLFHPLKHGERRRSGRKVLTQDFENLPSGAVLSRNLHCEDYIEIVCGSLDRLASAFAALDAEKRRLVLAGQLQGSNTNRTLPRPHLASASLSKADKRLVRVQAMQDRLRQVATG